MSERLPGTAPDPSDQRAAPRRSVIVPVTVVVADGRRLVGRTLDVSAVGLGLTLPENVNPGSAVAAAFDLPARLVVPSACKTAAGEGGAATGFPVDAGVLSSARARSPEFRQGSCSQLTFCSLTRAPDRPRASSAAIRSAGQ